VNSPVDAEEKGGSNDLLRWKEGGLSGPFFAVNCRLVRIGSYKFTPVGRVLFSSEGIMLQAPVFHTFNQGAAVKTESFKIFCFFKKLRKYLSMKRI
jgi:hypothetical protein